MNGSFTEMPAHFDKDVRSHLELETQRLTPLTVNVHLWQKMTQNLEFHPQPTQTCCHSPKP